MEKEKRLKKKEKKETKKKRKKSLNTILALKKCYDTKTTVSLGEIEQHLQCI